MNKTYLINSLNENLFDCYLYTPENGQAIKQQDPSFVAKKAAAKQRISALKERTRRMLKKHNWQKYFADTQASSDVEIKKASLFERERIVEDEQIDVNDSSYVSTIKFSFQMFDSVKKERVSKQTILNMSPLEQPNQKSKFLFY